MYRDGEPYYDDGRCHETESVDCYECKKEVALEKTDDIEIDCKFGNLHVNVCFDCIDGRTS